MALTDIHKKEAEERKREKRLVHLTNTLSRDFLNAKILKSKTKLSADTSNYIIKSFLDYIFFYEKKESAEINEAHLRHFMREYAPRKLSFTAEVAKEVPEILDSFLGFLDTEGYIKNGAILRDLVKENSRTFLKLTPLAAKVVTKKSNQVAAPKKKGVQKAVTEIRVGRNNPCPCGSGKKYKKCCGKSA